MYYDVIIIGAGAAGLMCAIEAGKRGRSVLVVDHANKPAEKIRISGGGRCNFTNLHASPADYLSSVPKFCISALKRYTQQDFIKLVEKHHIAYHEKTLGQLFCDNSSQKIIDMLLAECKAASVEIKLATKIESIAKTDNGFCIMLGSRNVESNSLVIATGGLSIPKMGATGFGYDIAKQFGIKLTETQAALVPFTLGQDMLTELKNLAGVSLEAEVSCGKKKFREGMLFTHRGLSGPSILQISSYWKPKQKVIINLLPDTDIVTVLKEAREKQPKQQLVTVLSLWLPKRLAQYIIDKNNAHKKLAEFSNKQLEQIAQSVNAWEVQPSGTEGYRTAEVTLGGVDTMELSSQTFEAKKVSGLYFIGEVVDVTGHLGGFNFQWAWASGFAAGQYA